MQRSIKALRAVTFSCIVLFLFFNPSLKYTAKTPDLLTLKFKPNQLKATDASWVLDALKYIDSTGAKKTLILTSFEHFVFAYYSDYSVELIWPLRKEHIDGLEGDFFIITEDSKLLRDPCTTFLPKGEKSCRQERTMKHFDRAAACTRVDLGRIRIDQHLGGVRKG